MNYQLKNRLKSLLDRMAQDPHAGAMFEADGDTIRDTVLELDTLRARLASVEQENQRHQEKYVILKGSHDLLIKQRDSLKVIHTETGIINAEWCARMVKERDDLRADLNIAKIHLEQKYKALTANTKVCDDLRAQLEREKGEREKLEVIVNTASSGLNFPTRQEMRIHIADLKSQLAAALEEVERLKGVTQPAANLIGKLAREVEDLKNQLAAARSSAKGEVDLLKEAMQFCCKVDCDGDTLNVGLARRIAAYLDAIRAEANQPAQGEGGENL